MKQEWWKKKLREDAELRFPDSEKNGNEPYRQPDSAQFLPRKIQPRTIAQYGAATAAALVLLAGAGVLIHRSGLRETGIPLESGGISYAASAPSAEETTAATTTQTTVVQTTVQSRETTTAASTAPMTVTELSLELGFTTDSIRAEPSAYVQMADGGYVLVGCTDEYADKRTAGNVGRSAFAARYDEAGQLQFIRLFGGDVSESFYKVIATRDGGFVACGNTGSRAGGDFDLYGITGAEGGSTLVVKFDAHGQVLWARSGASVGADNISGYGANSLRETADGHLVGMVEAYGPGGEGITHYRFHWDADGKLLTQREYEPVNVPVGYIRDVWIEEDGSLTGAGGGGGASKKSGVYFHSNADGSLAFQVEFPAIEFGGMLPLDDGQFLLVGQFSHRTSAGNLQQTGLKPPTQYQSKKSTGVAFWKMSADGKLVGGDMIVGLDDMGFARYLLPLDGGEALVQVHDMGKFIDPLSMKTRPESQVYLYRINAQGKLSRLYTSSSKLLTGVYDGLDGLIRQEDGSLRVLCLENTLPGRLRMLKLKNWN